MPPFASSSFRGSEDERKKEKEKRKEPLWCVRCVWTISYIIPARQKVFQILLVRRITHVFPTKSRGENEEVWKGLSVRNQWFPSCWLGRRMEAGNWGGQAEADRAERDHGWRGKSEGGKNKKGKEEKTKKQLRWCGRSISAQGNRIVVLFFISLLWEIGNCHGVFFELFQEACIINCSLLAITGQGNVTRVPSRYVPYRTLDAGLGTCNKVPWSSVQSLGKYGIPYQPNPPPP